MEKTVKIQIVNEMGDQTITVPISSALTRIRQETESGRWLYLDGEYSSVDTVSEQDLLDANQILLGDTLLGG